jgi:endo-1,4-beta-D-glucanase Y
MTDAQVDAARIADAGSDAGLTRGPTPPRAGANFPFPQNRETPRCSYPRAYQNRDVEAAYARWKADTVTAQGAGGHLRVQRPAEPGLEPNSTVSEGIAYGMLIAAYMADQALFDELWKYERMWLDDNGLMDWYINAAGTDRAGTGAATDADEDMAFALVLADRQWGGRGTLDRSYLEDAKDQIKRVWDHEIYEGKLPRAGDHWGDWNNVNISYFAPAYYRVFAQIDGNQAGWDAVLKTVYDTIDNALNASNGNQQNGLVPAWCTSRGVPGSPGHYQYDACRTPFRIGLDFCWFGEPRAQAYVAKTTQFFAALGVASIVDGYDLNGTPHPANPGGQSAAFIGPAAVGAMASPSQPLFMEQGYAALAGGKLLVGGTYYEESWTVLSLLMLTGNFLDLTQY